MPKKMFMEDIIVELKNQIDVMKKEYEKTRKEIALQEMENAQLEDNIELLFSYFIELKEKVEEDKDEIQKYQEELNDEEEDEEDEE